ncbi:MAG: sigma-70 family RNA polymerase sigma factor [Alphaproteobacteria bacterium]|nr:MAG: sigma-70 family RNA polymerase sigma factor [Alphaproteobacteria bacterium]
MTEFLDEIADCVPALRRYAFALTRDAEAGDDLVQDCLERAIRKQRLWRKTGSLEAWLFRILLNLHRNNIRNRKRQAHLVPIEELPAEPSAPPAQPGQVALNEIAHALERLPEEQRQVLLLVALEGFSYATAAEILDIPLGTLMSRLGRARAALRKLTRQGSPKPRLRTVK